MAGFSRKWGLWRLALLGFFGLTLSHCTTPTPASSSDEGEDFILSENEDDEEEDEKDSDIDMATLPHPKKATATATRILIMTTPLPPASELTSCADEIREMAVASSTDVDLQKAQMTLMKEVEANALLYHFCFYNLMNTLDLRLERGGPVMTELASDFFSGFRGLLILARTLDAYAGSSRYFGYLQRRYIQLSRDVFGRQVELMPSFGASRDSRSRDRERRSKPAGSVLP